MIYRVATNYNEFTLLVKVKTQRPEKICVVLKDDSLPNTVFTNRFHIINGEQTFFLRVPISGKNAMLCVTNGKYGADLAGDKTFEVTEIKQVPLEKKLDVIDFNNPEVKSYVAFCTKFCFNAGWLSSGTYKSEDGIFKLEYLPTIISSNTGKPLNTPARISQTSGRIQAAQDKLIPMTVPMRMAILLHEFSHFYVNIDKEDESEADLNGLLIYLGLGYPRIEAYEAFLKTFDGTPSQMNRDRYDIINKFITDFENQKIVMK